MYRQAIAKKKKGVVIASFATGIFMLVTLFIALEYPAAWALFGFCALFEGLIIFSNGDNIKKNGTELPGSSGDRC